MSTQKTHKAFTIREARLLGFEAPPERQVESKKQEPAFPEKKDGPQTREEWVAEKQKLERKYLDKNGKPLDPRLAVAQSQKAFDSWTKYQTDLKAVSDKIPFEQFTKSFSKAQEMIENAQVSLTAWQKVSDGIKQADIKIAAFDAPAAQIPEPAPRKKEAAAPQAEKPIPAKKEQPAAQPKAVTQAQKPVQKTETQAAAPEMKQQTPAQPETKAAPETQKPYRYLQRAVNDNKLESRDAIQKNWDAHQEQTRSWRDMSSKQLEGVEASILKTLAKDKDGTLIEPKDAIKLSQQAIDNLRSSQQMRTRGPERRALEKNIKQWQDIDQDLANVRNLIRSRKIEEQLPDALKKFDSVYQRLSRLGVSGNATTETRPDALKLLPNGLSSWRNMLRSVIDESKGDETKMQHILADRIDKSILEPIERDKRRQINEMDKYLVQDGKHLYDVPFRKRGSFDGQVPLLQQARRDANAKHDLDKKVTTNEEIVDSLFKDKNFSDQHKDIEALRNELKQQ